MAISVDWNTKIISVPQSYLTNLGNNIYELDVNQFRLDLRNLEDDNDGMAFPETHSHNTVITLSGVSYTRIFEVINGYTILFENGSYTVKCTGANHNISDVKIVNSVSLLIGNSAGLIQVTSGSGVIPQDIADIADAVWNEQKAGHTTASSYGKIVQDLELLIKQVKSLSAANL